ncbi:hypothetical protein CJD35_11515 [Sphingobium xenophagum]|uniref:Uncharacterized protein n=1 Tax=Sphingobium xenophagum TaxID=121428 RepID=A0A249MV26_SPHXE|nr:hypothetical protein [Sphingobium xenophagum]ASY44999.1 hypothetical protein CJD35_11515 [Sphingobium xenophagum]
MANDAAPPFWLVWCRRGRQPVYEHESYHSARAEAERLSRCNPGEAFYVLAPVARGGFDRFNLCWSHYAQIGNDTHDDFHGEHAPDLEQ